MDCQTCKNYEPEETGWKGCYVNRNATYSNDGSCGRDNPEYPRLERFVRGEFNGQPQTRAGFLTQKDAQRFLDSLPADEK